MTPARFRKLVLKHFEERGRHGLPWRATDDPYRILVSEVMLQQTQVERVIPFYEAFLERFPNVRALAEAPLADVLVRWQGLGYNRRAKMLHEAAKAVVREHEGVVPIDVAALESLPGVGHYTARAVAAFAGNRDVVFVETNLRTAVVHHFFPGQEGVADAEISAVLDKALPRGDARRWYGALMDYGSFLKRSGVRTNTRVKGYAKQAAFAGSGREARGAALRALAEGPATAARLRKALGAGHEERMEAALRALAAEGMIERRGGSYRLAS